MAASQPPTENLPAFNSTVFKDANTESLSLSKAQSLFLGRTGNATSVATTTTFTSDIYANSIRVGRGGATASTNVSLGGTIGTTANNCTSVGGTAQTNNSYATAIGYAAQALNNYSIAIGYSASSTGANQVVIGTAAETMYCVGNGLTNSTGASLIATADIFVNGTIRAGMGVNGTLTTPATSQQTAFGVGALVANNTTAGSTAFGYNALKLYTGQSTFTTPTAFGSNALSKLVIGGYACAFGTNALLNATGTSNNAFGANAGVSITTGIANVFIGGDYPVGGGTPNKNTISTGDNNVFVGQEPTCASTGTSNSIILGAKCTITGNNAVAIGYQVSAGANEIVLGGTGQTVLAKGTGTSITASGAISAVGAVTTTSAGGMSARVYNLDEYNATANTPYAGSLLQQGSIGSIRIYNDKVGGTTPVATQLYISTMTAAKVSVDSLILSPTSATFSGGILSTGTGSAGLLLYNVGTGTNNYYSQAYTSGSSCELLIRNDSFSGTPAATQFNFYTYTTLKAQTTSMIIGNSAIQMNLPITLQSTYSASAGAGQLGQVVSSTSTSFSVTTATAVSFASFTSLPAGVWAFSYTIDLTTAGGTVTATIQSLYMTLTNNGAYSTKVAYGGSTRTHNTIVYAIADNPCFSSALTYSTTATTSFYPTFLISFTGAGATITANGYATATRIG